jgi:hypothetical protein
MARPVDNFSLERWQATDSHVALAVLADYAKQDTSFVATTSVGTTRWHASAGGHDFEMLCSGPKFFDTRARRGGGGAVDLAMHLYGFSFKQAAKCLKEKGL